MIDPELIDRYLNNTASEAERAEVEAWFDAEGQPEYLNNEPQQIEEAGVRTLAVLQARINTHSRRVLRGRVYRYAAAAVVLLAVGIYFFLTREKPAPQVAVATEILPGTHTAVLKTGSGKVIALNSANGVLDKGISKTGQTLSYNNAASLAYDTLYVPAGSKPYHLQLADGSRILLNAATTLRYPENTRGQLELISGEIYAEIKHDAAAPFSIQTPAQQIEDIGTTFDVSAYPDEPAAFTVLIEGAVKVNGKLLSPGQQALSQNQQLNIQSANITARTAWVKGLFYFNHTPLKTILRDVSRWYDIQVVYEGNAGNDTYSGVISRDASLQRMLSIIGAGDVHYRIEDRKLIILP
jgi:transmembrane sensor